MRSFLPVLLLGVIAVFGQQPGTPQVPPAPAPELVEITEDTVVGKVNGQDFTAGDLERITQELRADQRKTAGLDPQKFLEEYGYVLLLMEEARKAGIEKKKPYRAKIEAAVRDIVVNGLVEEKTKQIKIDPAEVRRDYDENIADFKQAKVKVIFVSRAATTHDFATNTQRQITPEEAKKKIEKAAELVRGGKDFAAVAKEYSDDTATAEKGADFPFPIRGGTTSVPQEMRTAILAAKTGDIVGPLEHPTGFYLFRVESSGTADFSEAKDEIERGLRQAAVKRWLDEIRKKATASLDHKPFWNTYIAANKAIAESEKQAQPANGDKK